MTVSVVTTAHNVLDGNYPNGAGVTMDVSPGDTLAVVYTFRDVDAPPDDISDTESAQYEFIDNQFLGDRTFGLAVTENHPGGTDVEIVATFPDPDNRGIVVYLLSSDTSIAPYYSDHSINFQQPAVSGIDTIVSGPVDALDGQLLAALTYVAASNSVQAGTGFNDLGYRWNNFARAESLQITADGSYQALYSSQGTMDARTIAMLFDDAPLSVVADVPPARLALSAPAFPAHATAHVTAAVPAAQLALLAPAFAAQVSADIDVPMPVASLALSSPTLDALATDHVTINVPPALLTLTTDALAVAATGHLIADVPPAQLLLSPRVFNAIAGADIDADVPPAQLVLSPRTFEAVVLGQAVPVRAIALTDVRRHRAQLVHARRYGVQLTKVQ